MKCATHPKYTAKFPPRCNCVGCWEVWLRKDFERVKMIRAVLTHVQITPGLFRFV